MNPTGHIIDNQVVQEIFAVSGIHSLVYTAAQRGIIEHMISYVMWIDWRYRLS